MTRFKYNITDDEYKKLYCPICQEMYITKMCELENLLCLKCKSDLLFTITGEEEDEGLRDNAGKLQESP